MKAHCDSPAHRKARGRISWFRQGALLLTLSHLLLAASTGAQKTTSANYAHSVNPFIGTGGDPDDGIDLFPGAVRPFGMVQLSPDTEDHGFGYEYIHKWIKGFSMTHMSGAGCANEGDVFFTATTGPVVTQAADYQSPYSHKREQASAGYYQVELLQWGIEAELTATERTGAARFTFPAGQSANILVPISHTLNETASAQIRVVGDRRIEGYVEDHGFCSKKQTYKVYFVMEFSRAFASYGVWTGDQYGGEGKIARGVRTASQSSHEGTTGAYASWDPQPHEQVITASIGISYVDVQGAANNLEAEAKHKDFDTLRREAEEAWNHELGLIEVSGGSAQNQRVFYTALYHSMLMPSLFDDADGRYLGFDGAIHSRTAGHHVYTNFSGWDIYRSEMPLLAMIEPQRMQDMAESIVLMYEQGGWIDRWPQINLYTNDMVGSPLSIVIATAWLDGLHGFDIEKAWEGMKKDVTEAPPPGRPYLGEEGIEWLNRLHYLPADKVNYGSVARTQEHSLACASLYRLAQALGKTAEARDMHARALYHRNLFNPEDRFFRPRNADGSWPDFNPALDGHGFVEGTGWHYQSFAPADLRWLIDAVGQEQFNARMSAFFDYPEPGWYAQYYNPYNESDLHAPFVFHFSGQPWQTQRIVRRVLSENYFDAPDGIPGNDDGGAMSSWAVLTMMGIYSVDPASLAYELVSPSFSKVVIHLNEPYQGASFTISTKDEPDAHPYIQSTALNKRTHTQNWIRFSDISSGGTLEFTLGSAPNRQWGSRPEDSPPSLTDAR